MAEYKNQQANFGLTCDWTCRAVTGSNGTVAYMFDRRPTEVRKDVVFNVSIPQGAVVSKVWITVEKSGREPIGGARYKRINSIDILTTNSAEIDKTVFVPTLTQYTATFSFLAYGVIYEDTNVHTATWDIVNPTLHVEYYLDETEIPDMDIAVDTSKTNDNDPSDGRYILPRLLGSDWSEKARLRPSSVSLELNLNPLSTAQMVLPDGEEEVRVRDMVELFAPTGSVGTYRVSEVQTVRGHGGRQSVYLEHALATLADSLASGVQAMTGSVADVVTTLLAAQNDPHWMLGDCDVPLDYELIYEYTDDNLLKAIMGIVELLPEGYVLEFNTRVHPFIMHIRKVEDTAFCEARLSRNIASVQETIDARELCTRVTPYGAGRGTDRIELTGLTGQAYIDADTQDVWGVVAHTFVNEDIYDAIMLKEVAQKYLDKHKNPAHSIEIDGFDLSRITGEELDRFRMGRMCRVPLPAYNTTLYDRVISKRYPDVYNKPDKVIVTLANKIRNVGDEIASLFRDVTNSKLIGGSITVDESTNSAGEIYVDSPFVMYFDVKEYGNLIAVRLTYKCINTYTNESTPCRVYVDGQQLPDNEDKGGVVDLLRYLETDANGVPMLGQHTITLSPKGSMDDEFSVTARLIVKTVERK